MCAEALVMSLVNLVVHAPLSKRLAVRGSDPEQTTLHILRNPPFQVRLLL